MSETERAAWERLEAAIAERTTPEGYVACSPELLRAAAARIRELEEVAAKLARCLAATDRLVTEHHSMSLPPDVNGACGVCHEKNALRQLTANHAALSRYRVLAHAHNESQVRNEG